MSKKKEEHHSEPQGNDQPQQPKPERPPQPSPEPEPEPEATEAKSGEFPTSSTTTAQLDFDTYRNVKLTT